MNFRIALVSDGTGETVETIYRAALAQFDGLNAQVERFRGVISAEQALEVADNFAAHGGNLIVTTLVQPEVRDAISNAAALHSIPVVNMLEPLIEGIQHVTHFVPLKRPGALRQMDERYKRRVRAIEFTIQCDDGKSPQLMTQADIVLFGVSRAEKRRWRCFWQLKDMLSPMFRCFRGFRRMNEFGTWKRKGASVCSSLQSAYVKYVVPVFCSWGSTRIMPGMHRLPTSCLNLMRHRT